MRTPDAQAAVRIWPQNADGWRELAAGEFMTNPLASLRDATHAVEVNREDWENWGRLAQTQFELDRIDAARQSMAQMLMRQQGFDAPWLYANLLLLSGDGRGFWNYTARALSYVPDRQLAGRLEDCARSAGGDYAALSWAVKHAQTLAAGTSERFALARAYLSFLINHAQPDEARSWWREIVTWWQGDPARRPELASLGMRYVELLLQSGRPDEAGAVWTDGTRTQLFDMAVGPSPDQRVTDPQFQLNHDTSPFIWKAACAECQRYYISERSQDRAGLRLDFDGTQPEDAILIYQWLLLSPCSRYQLSFDSRRIGQTQETGVSVRAVALGSNGAEIVLARVPAPLASQWQTAAVDFATPQAARGYKVEIDYTRPLGEMLLRDSALITGVTVNALASKGCDQSSTAGRSPQQASLP